MPAGNLRKLQMAVLYGADAVYLGTPDLSLRTKSEFTLDQVIEGVNFCHAHGKRAYLTLNLFSHNKDVAKLDEYIDTVRRVAPDGLIVADPGVFRLVRQRAPEIALHVSTQSNVASWLSVDFWRDQGADLVVLAREVTFDELAEIREKCPDVRLEAFVHGAMCMTYSGRCLLSNFMAERGANQGNCANSCRWNYRLKLRLRDGTTQPLDITDENAGLFEFLLEEGCRPGELMPIEEDARGSYILNSRDLCLMPRLDDYLGIGIDCLKVEGRGKSEYYVAVVARAYRMAIDDYYRDPKNWSPRPYMAELMSVTNRGYTLAFHDGRPTNYAHDYEQTESLSAWDYAGVIEAVSGDAFWVDVKNRLVAGDVLEFIPPDARETVLLRLYGFELAETREHRDTVHGGPKTVIRIPFSAFDHEDPDSLRDRLPVRSVIRREKPLSDEQRSRLAFDKLTLALENRRERGEKAYEKRRDALVGAVGASSASRQAKTPRIGTEGCCGKGCNGCMIFWNDPAYARARKVLSDRKQGARLDRREARTLTLKTPTH
ncbi:MAG: U32 family peptidase [Paracoccaceae bacterium]